ncbi:dihydrodipicolinate synthase family protein [Bartonella sp. LJL80]
MTDNQRTVRYKGVFPVVPTIFDAAGNLDLSGQRRCVDFMIDSGSDGLCILANFSEQFVLSDQEREILTKEILDHVAGRVPVIVTTTHFSSQICAARSLQAQQWGAAMVMIMPPYHGATLRVSEEQIFEFYKTVSDSINIPIMIQDAPMSGTFLSVSFLVRMAKALANVAYFKIETPQAANKLRQLIAEGGHDIEGPWDGEEGITLLSDLKAGATGAMTGGGYVDGIKQIFDPFMRGDQQEALAAYTRWLPLINLENRLGGFASAKILMKEGGIIRYDGLRAPQRPVSAAVRAEIIEMAKHLDALALRWDR